MFNNSFSFLYSIIVFITIFICIFFIPLFSKNSNFSFIDKESFIIGDAEFLWPTPRLYYYYFIFWETHCSYNWRI